MQWALGPIRVDLSACVVERDGAQEALTPTEVSLLGVLADHAGQAVSRDQLMTEALGYAPGVRSRAVDHAMARLRKKIEVDPTDPRHLHSVRGIGYRLDLPLAEDEDLVGRSELLDQVTRRARAGLTVLVGPGGVGKTRLARAVAQRRNTLAFVEAAGARSAAGLVAAVAGALELPLVNGPLENQESQVARVLERQGARLLVLDNLEQLDEPGFAVLGRWVARLPALAVLATSRRPTGVAGETLLPVRPLPAEDGVTLYVQRARERMPDFRPTPAERALIARFVDSVDGLPLAIELAASRIRLLSPADVVARAEKALSLRGSSTSHAATTLEECIGWSWELLDAQARTGWLAAATFEEGFSLDLWEQVAGLDDGLAVLEELLEHHLVEVRPVPGEAHRYHLLVTLHQFARKQLDRARERDRLIHRHARTLASAVRARMRAAEATGDLSWLLRERANLRVAFDRAIDHDPRAAIACLRGLEVVFQDRGPAAERQQLTQRAHEALGEDGPADLRVLVLFRLALGRIAGGQVADALPVAERAMALYDALTDPVDRARALLSWASVQMHLGRWADAVTTCERCAEQAIAGNDPFLQGLAHYNRGHALEVLGQSEPALQAVHRAVLELERAQAPVMQAAAHALVSWIQGHRGDLDAARASVERAASLVDPDRGRLWLQVQHSVALLDLAAGQPDRALERFTEAADVAQRQGIAYMHANQLEGRALALADLGRWDEADTAFRACRAAHQAQLRAGDACRALALAGAVVWNRGQPEPALRLLSQAADEAEEQAPLMGLVAGTLHLAAIAPTDVDEATRRLTALRERTTDPGPVHAAMLDLAAHAIDRAGGSGQAPADTLDRAARLQATSPELRLLARMVQGEAP